MKNVSESLAGRIGILRLMGLSLRELGVSDATLSDTKDYAPFISTREYLMARNAQANLLIMENGCLYPLEIKKTATPKQADASVFRVLDRVKNMSIGAGGIICMGSFGILDKERYSIPIWFI
jgi:hypothetical protein